LRFPSFSSFHPQTGASHADWNDSQLDLYAQSVRRGLRYAHFLRNCGEAWSLACAVNLPEQLSHASYLNVLDLSLDPCGSAEVTPRVDVELDLEGRHSGANIPLNFS
jgi:hypothetical protein